MFAYCRLFKVPLLAITFEVDCCKVNSEAPQQLIIMIFPADNIRFAMETAKMENFKPLSIYSSTKCIGK